MTLSNYVIDTLKLNGYSVEMTEINKNNILKPAIKVTPNDSRISSVIYVDKDMECMLDDGLIGHILNIMSESDIPAFEEDTFSWLNCKDKARICLRPSAKEKDPNRITRPLRDLEQYVRIFLDRKEFCSFEVTKDILNNFKITEDELFKAAEKNTANSVTIKTFFEALGLPRLDDRTMYIVRNNEAMFGAGAIASPTCLKYIHDVLKEDFYILPSSIHEVLIIPTSDTSLSISELKELVMSVNSSCVLDTEFLSNNIYLYNHESTEVFIIK